MSRHFLGLEGAQTIGTRPFQQTQSAVADLVNAMAMGAFHGDAGHGKTFALEYACEQLTGAEWCKLDIPPSVRNIRWLALALLKELTGVEHHGERFKLQADLIDELSLRPRLVVIDEAQNLERDLIEFLRHLHDHRSTTFALALAGGNGCWRVLSRYPMLRSRVYRRVPFPRMTPETVLDVLPYFHAIHNLADHELLLRVDEHFAHGNFRNWTAFTKDALKVAGEQNKDTLDEDIVGEVFLRRGAADADVA